MLIILVSIFIFYFFCRQGLEISSTVMASRGRGGTSCSAMVKDLAVAVFVRETLCERHNFNKSFVKIHCFFVKVFLLQVSCRRQFATPT